MSALGGSFLLRKMLGFSLLLLASILLVQKFWIELGLGDGRVLAALTGGLVAAGATALGALPVMLARPLSERTQDTLYGFGAGVMLAACAFSLVIPGIAAAKTMDYGSWGSALIVGGGLLLGALMLLLIERLLPHEHFIKGCEGPAAQTLRRTWLFVFAIALHNLPEGLAIGVAYGGTDSFHAGALALGIAIQDVPEGLVVASALLVVGYSRLKSVLLATLTGVIEPLGALLGVGAVSLVPWLLPIALGFAAGAMLFVISHEIIPESHRKGHEIPATTGLMLGFVMMMVLDTALT
jgi:ZIP family zinc transporter